MGEDIDLSKVEEILQKFAKEEASLIPVLQEVQGLFGYLPEGDARGDRPGIGRIHEQGVRSGDVLLPVLPHEERETHSAGMPGYGVPRAGWKVGPEHGEGFPRREGRRNDGRFQLLTGNGGVPRHVLSGARNDGGQELLRQDGRPQGAGDTRSVCR